MMRIDSFGRSAAFAAVAALGWMPWVVCAGPLLGWSGARTAYLVMVAALYAGGLAKSPPRRAATVVGMLGAGFILTLFVNGGGELSFALATALGVSRSLLLHRGPSPRAVVLESGLLICGLAFARFLGGGPLAVWGFFLVQSCFFLGGRTAAHVAVRLDPFDQAWARSVELMDRSGG